MPRIKGKKIQARKKTVFKKTVLRTKKNKAKVYQINRAKSKSKSTQKNKIQKEKRIEFNQTSADKLF
jgi:hypothetical protein